MPDKDKPFKLKDSDRMIKDVIDSFFQEEDVAHDLEELQQVQLEGIESGTEIQNTNL